MKEGVDAGILSMYFTCVSSSDMPESGGIWTLMTSCDVPTMLTLSDNSPANDTTDGLLNLTMEGDRQALDRLLRRYSDRLARMVRLNLDVRLCARTDPEDIVQDSLVVAAQRLPEFLLTRPVHFYVWLRKIACQRISDAHRRHLYAARRSVAREICPIHYSSARLADMLISQISSPCEKLAREERNEQIQAALLRLPIFDQEVLSLLYLEHLSISEAAEVVGVSNRALVMRHLRALERIRPLLEKSNSND